MVSTLTKQFKPIVLIPSFNPGPKGLETAISARKFFSPILWISDGSTDESDDLIEAYFIEDPGFTLLRCARNQGKGAAIYAGLIKASEEGYSHVLTMDADGQHPPNRIQDFLDAARKYPDDMILGTPVFGRDAPRIRVEGRKISNTWVRLETFGAEIGDSLFGFRVYPLEALLNTMQNTQSMRRFDFDPEAVVRLSWKGLKAINIECDVRYPDASEGGISHFHYVRDNLILSLMHLRLFSGFILRLPMFLIGRLRGA